MDYQIEYFKKIGDDRGQLVVFLKESDLEGKAKKFGQIYFVTFNKKGVVRGNHFHTKWREWFGIVDGKVVAMLKDVKTNKTKKLILNARSHKYIRLIIGPHIAHAFKSLTKKASLLNYSNTVWSKTDAHFYKLL